MSCVLPRKVCRRRNLAADATLSCPSKQGGPDHDQPSSFCHCSFGPAQTPEQLLELTQEHIRPLIAMIDRLNEAGAEHELRVITKQLTRLVFRAQPLPSGK